MLNCLINACKWKKEAASGRGKVKEKNEMWAQWSANELHRLIFGVLSWMNYECLKLGWVHMYKYRYFRMKIENELHF